MAFERHRVHEARMLKLRDRLLLDTLRGCFHNPTRDRGRVIGEARVMGNVADVAESLEIAGREHVDRVPFELLSLSPLGTGVELAPLVPRLRAFPDPLSWSARVRWPLVPLDGGDSRQLREHLGRGRAA